MNLKKCEGRNEKCDLLANPVEKNPKGRVSGQGRALSLNLERLAEAARAYPQSAYSAFTRSVSCEWAYLQRVVNGCDVEFQRLRDTIRHVFTPAVVGREILEKEHDLLELPARFGGLALADPVKTASQAFAVSQEATRLLKDAVFTGADINMADHMATANVL